MSNTEQIHDDLDAYIATFDEKERQELAHAEAALDLASLLYQARKARGWTQKIAAKLSGVRQQAISRWERAHANMQIDTLRTYLEALGYNLELVIKDAETGEIVATTELPDTVQPAEAQTEAFTQQGTLPQQPGRIQGYQPSLPWPWWHEDRGTTPGIIWHESPTSGPWGIHSPAMSGDLFQLYGQSTYMALNQSLVAAWLPSVENKDHGFVRYVVGGWQSGPGGSLEVPPYLADNMAQGQTTNDVTFSQQPVGAAPMVQVGA